MCPNRVRTILLIEDNELNREMLRAMLEPQYHVIEAENGAEGLERLNEYKNRISLILLDLQMPVMDGYQFLDAIRNKSRYANIPIIVTTSSEKRADEIACLERGATDFVTKPYNPDIVLRRISSMIRLSEASTIINRVEYDDVTELYSKEFFYIYAERTLNENRNVEYDMVCGEVHSFQLLVDRYGEKATDRMLGCVAKYLRSLPGALCGRMSRDAFAILTEHKDMDAYKRLLEGINAAIKQSPVPQAVVNLGVYTRVNHTLPVAVIFDNASLASYNIRNQYNRNIAEYDEALKNKLIRRQTIVYSMEDALKERQFEVYYQPKFDLKENKLGGAEALIRWRHPELGALSPGEFIPLFEQNGFISKLDRYIAEQVCEDMYVWKQAGYKTVPVSINVSRVDFENPNLADELEELVTKYGLDHAWIHFEVTESAYSDNPDRVCDGVKALRNMGFGIEIDDFGSGYSSLKMLDELEFDVLKLDMSLVRSTFSEKRKFVLQYIFTLADRLDVDIVAEGIETEEQVTAFRGMGCKYAQGYYYSKPVPKNEFENYLKEKKL